jgi:tRNA pseudouridine38-40 synthase
MARYKIEVEYDGGPFFGWQRQNGRVSIQQRLEESMVPFLKKTVVLTGSGRTDAGVHAVCQVAHFDFDGNIDCFRLRQCMNFYLMDVPISVLSVQEAPDGFNARLGAIERSYVYKILNRAGKPCLDAGRVWHVPSMLDAEKMHRSAQCLVGKHDFSSFRAAGCQSKSPIKTLNSISVARDGNIVKTTVAARSFLYHQVRNIVGSLQLVGCGKLSEEEFRKILNARDRTKAGQTAPACGLYFMGTKY